MPTASQYISTGNLAISDRERSSSGFLASNGVSYLTTITNYLNILKNNGYTYYIPFTPLVAGSTNNSQAKFYVDVYKTLGPNRCGMQNFNTHTWVTTRYEDRLIVPGRSLTLNTSTGTTLATNSWYSPWPVVGVTAFRNSVTPWFNWLKSQGVTLDALMIDWEGTPYGSDSMASDLFNAMTGATQFYQTYYGLSSWNELYAYFNGNCSGSLPTSGQNRYSWWPIPAAYISVAFKEALLEPLLNNFPNAVMSNYKMAEEDYVSPMNGEPNYVDPEYGQRLTKIANCGNAAGNELYGSMLQSANIRIVNSIDGKRLDPYNSLSGITNYFRQFNKQIKRGPWSSFILTMTEARATKRGRPDLALTPWIGPVNWAAIEYTRGSLEHRLSSGSQSSVGALNTTWFYNNLSVSSGFTAYDGTTSAYRIITNNSITNASLEYYVNGISSGNTYVFSYYTNLSSGFTNPQSVYQKVEHFVNWTYGIQRGITFFRTLPSATGPFYNIGYQNLTGYSGWTKVEIEFNPIKVYPDISDNTTLAISVFGCSGASVSGITSFFSHPTLELKSSPSNIPIFVRNPTDEYRYIGYADAPPIGFSNLVAGYNPESAMYVDRPGNSAYYYEYLRQLALLGTKHFGYFTGPLFSNYGFTGSLQNWVNRGKNDNDFYTSSFALANGWTGYLNYEREFNDTLHDVNTKIGGFTLTTADYSEYDWNSPYFANGAPSLNGTTWWWRVTVKPGYTMYVDGITLSSRGGYPVGAWYGATGPTLANAGLTWTAWELPGEPGYTAPTKIFDFLGMTYNNRVKEVGFNLRRSTTATYVGSSGYLMTAAINEPRLDYDPETLEPRGLLVEATTTNLLNWSETFATSGGCNNNWIDINLNRTPNNISPSGDTSAIRFTATGSNGILLATTGVTTATIYGSWSCWFRGISGNESLSVSLNGGTSWKEISNLSTKWRRFGSQLTMKELGMNNSSFHMAFKLGNTNDSVEIWGAQVERRRQPYGSFNNLDPLAYVDYTSYVKSNATRGTRGSDWCDMEGTSFSSWFGKTQGTFLFETNNLKEITVADASGYYYNYDQELFYEVRSNGSVYVLVSNQPNADISASCGNIVFAAPQTSFPLNKNIKSMVSYAPHGIKISSNGNLGTSTINSGVYNYNSFNNLSVTRITGQLQDTPIDQGYVRKIIYWNYLWNNIDMRAMTLANVEPSGIFNPYG